MPTVFHGRLITFVLFHFLLLWGPFGPVTTITRQHAKRHRPH
jgi:hypothetical protein